MDERKRSVSSSLPPPTLINGLLLSQPTEFLINLREKENTGGRREGEKGGKMGDKKATSGFKEKK